jgi:hypothetical protein
LHSGKALYVLDLASSLFLKSCVLTKVSHIPHPTAPGQPTNPLIYISHIAGIIDINQLVCWDGVSLTFCLGCIILAAILLISSTQVGGITVVSHSTHSLEYLYFYICSFKHVILYPLSRDTHY